MAAAQHPVVQQQAPSLQCVSSPFPALSPHTHPPAHTYVHAGCPRLPPGGLAALQPRLTVVRKQPSGVDSAQQGTTPVGSFKVSARVHTHVCAWKVDVGGGFGCTGYVSHG